MKHQIIFFYNGSRNHSISNEFLFHIVQKMVNAWVMVNLYLLSSPSLSTVTFTYIFAMMYIQCKKKKKTEPNNLFLLCPLYVCVWVNVIQYCIERNGSVYEAHLFLFFVVHFSFEWNYLNFSQFGIFKALVLFLFFTFFQFGFFFSVFSSSSNYTTIKTITIA